MRLRAYESICNIVEDLRCVNDADAEDLAYLLIKEKTNLKPLLESLGRLEQFDHCGKCNFWTLNSSCEFCDEENERTRDILCIVPDSITVIAIEKSDVFIGIYYVLNAEANVRTLNDDLKKIDMSLLHSFIKKNNFKEIVLATNFTPGGEWTARYIKQELISKWKNIKFTRIACGVPTGAELYYVDAISLRKAFLNRNKFEYVEKIEL